MEGTTLRFSYRKTSGEVSEYTVRSWHEEGHYIVGYAVEAAGPRTFRKDRVVAYMGGCEAFLQYTDAPAPTLRKTEKEAAPQILFTGFASHIRAALEAEAAAAGLDVVKTVTVGLTYLCGGPNAGPAKLQAARSKRTYILSENQFRALLATGELPDEEVAAVA